MGAARQQLTKYYAIIIGIIMQTHCMSHRTYQNLLVAAATSYRLSLIIFINKGAELAVVPELRVYIGTFHLPISHA